MAIQRRTSRRIRLGFFLERSKIMTVWKENEERARKRDVTHAVTRKMSHSQFSLNYLLHCFRRPRNANWSLWMHHISEREAKKRSRNSLGNFMSFVDCILKGDENMQSKQQQCCLHNTWEGDGETWALHILVRTQTRVQSRMHGKNQFSIAYFLRAEELSWLNRGWVGAHSSHLGFFRRSEYLGSLCKHQMSVGEKSRLWEKEKNGRDGMRYCPMAAMTIASMNITSGSREKVKYWPHR